MKDMFFFTVVVLIFIAFLSVLPEKLRGEIGVVVQTTADFLVILMAVGVLWYLAGQVGDGKGRI